MTFPKLLLPLVAASTFLGGCVYEEADTGYREPRRVYHSGYAEREVVVVNDRPRHYRNDYYRQRPVTVYNDRPRAVYGGGVVVAPGRYHNGESYKERQERLIREAQRREDDHHDKKDDGHKKKKKKDHDDD